jgi:hypothetical protein
MFFSHFIPTSGGEVGDDSCSIFIAIYFAYLSSLMGSKVPFSRPFSRGLECVLMMLIICHEVYIKRAQLIGGPMALIPCLVLTI